MQLGTLAIVGAPSAGKSTIFNRIVGERRAIVEPTRGVTRDRLYAKGEWLTKEFTVIDTGGIQIKDAPFQEEIRAQVDIAIEQADVILFVVDGKLGCSQDDKFIARLLQKSNKHVILAANKIDSIQEIGDLTDFYRLGMGEPMAVSGAHGIGIGDLLDKVVSLLPEKESNIYENAISFCLIGRPNVGKSSLSNRFLNNQRTIVSNIAGTTRDSVDSPFTFNDQNYVVIDTAGLVKRGKIYEAIDKYAALRALAAIDRAQVAVLLIDGEVGITEQDKHVVGYAVEAKKAVVIVVNKWDIAKGEKDAEEFTKQIRKEFKFLDYAPILYVSAKTGHNVEKILPAISKAFEGYNRRIPTNVLNDIILDAQAMNPTPLFNHGRLKIVYASQIDVCPPRFVLFCNDPKFVHFSYTRYLLNRLRETFDFEGTPIDLVYRQRK